MLEIFTQTIVLCNLKCTVDLWWLKNFQPAAAQVATSRRCTTHALYRSKLWQQDHCQHPQNTNPDGSTLEGTAQRIGRPFGRLRLWSLVWGPLHSTSHLRNRLESQHLSVPGCAEECGDPLVQSGGRWQILSVAARLGADPQAQRDQGLASEGVLRLCTLLSLDLLLSRPELTELIRLVIVENITNMTSHNTKANLIAAIHRVFADLPPALVEKACSQFRISIVAVIEAEGSYIE